MTETDRLPDTEKRSTVNREKVINQGVFKRSTIEI